ncbi:MAG: hypothetical protein AAGF15_04765 [Pseudomonadota bacterium]
MKMSFIASAALALVPGLAMAQDYSASGDKAAGESAFRQCQTCHVVETPGGERLAGRGAKIGPNLYGVVSRQAGSYDGYNYSKYMVAAGEKGLKWNESDFVAYVQNPTGFLRTYLDDPKARGKMAFRVRSEADATNLYAYLLDLGPAPKAAAPAAEEAAPAPSEAAAPAAEEAPSAAEPEPASEEAAPAPEAAPSAAEPEAAPAAAPTSAPAPAEAPAPEATDTTEAEAAIDAAVASGIEKIQAAAAQAIKDLVAASKSNGKAKDQE